MLPQGSSPTLEDVHNVLGTNFEIKDFRRVDVALAVALAQKERGIPLWVFFVGASGDGKSEFLRPISAWKEAYIVDNFTKNTLISGREVTEDFVLKLNNHLVVTLDLANLSSKDAKEKKEIFAQLRNIYDGLGYRATGSGKVTQYEGLYFNWLAATTNAFDNQFIISQELGSRELLFRVHDEGVNEGDVLDKALDNENHLTEIRKKVAEVVVPFLDVRPFNSVPLSDNVRHKLKDYAQDLALMRAPGQFNSFDGDLHGDVTPEKPTRLVQQFKRLYCGLKSLDENYDDEQALSAIKRVALDSGDPYRRKVRDFMRASEEGELLTLSAVARGCKMGKRPTNERLHSLWSLGLVDKEVEEIKNNYDQVVRTNDKWRWRGGQQKLDE